MKILAVAGASGGHIYPALAFLEQLKAEKNVSDLLLVLPSRSIKFGLNDRNCRVEYISSARLYFSLSRKNIFAFLSFAKGAWESLRIFFKFKPDVVVGFGSIDSIPLIMIAWFFRVKAIIHEQNVLPGKANRFLSKFADKVAVSFPQSCCYLDLPEDKISLTGNPIRTSLQAMSREKALDFFKLGKDKFTILVAGGSQGSRRINSVFLKTLSLIKEKERLQIIHLTGRLDQKEVMEKYSQLNLEARVFGFLENIYFAYSAADLAITRAGATTLAELIYFRLPAIIVPYPFAHGHQSLNAGILKNSGAVFILDDNSFDADNLKTLLEGLIYDPDKIAKMRIGYDRFPGDNAALALVNLVSALV